MEMEDVKLLLKETSLLRQMDPTSFAATFGAETKGMKMAIELGIFMI